MKILHSADWHLDASLKGREALKEDLLGVPGQLAALCRRERCDLVLLSGDLFDGPCTRESLRVVRDALEAMEVPVVIAPGNHDFWGPDSPWGETWPENVHIFRGERLEYRDYPQLSCRVYGAGYESMDCPGLLEGFRAEGPWRYAVMALHGDPLQAASPYCPVTRDQVMESGLDYLALGHIHKEGSFRAGGTLCAWPGCPMGRGYDETGVRGALIVTLGEVAQARFYPLDTPRFYDWEAPVVTTPEAALEDLLADQRTGDHYRITFTGEGEAPDLEALKARFPAFASLELRDRTVPPVDLWAQAGEDSFAGLYFGKLRALAAEDPEVGELAARISRQILAGQEVKLL